MAKNRRSARRLLHLRDCPIVDGRRSPRQPAPAISKDPPVSELDVKPQSKSLDGFGVDTIIDPRWGKLL